MASTRSRVEAREERPPLPKIAALVREAWWLILVAAAIYLIAALYTYHPTDPGWSNTGSNATVLNAGGLFGAWLSDLLLYVFGFSAYWFAVFFLYLIWWSYRRLETSALLDRRPLFVAIGGFLLLLLGSSGIEAVRPTAAGMLPFVSGGMLGNLLSVNLVRAFGATGAMLGLLALAVIGLSLFTGLSWLALMEKIGTGIEEGFSKLLQRIGYWRDSRLGAKASTRREAVVTKAREKIKDQEPVMIASPVVDIPKSPRAESERQTPLFAELPDSPLPPLHLLDAFDAEFETLSPETLEFTSRLIERKLLDFGVEVKVLTAHPGPVITRYEIEPAVGVKGSQITNLARDLARALSVVSVRVVETIPGKPYMGLEIPNPNRQIVRLSEIIASAVYAGMASPLTIAMGKDIAGHPVVADLAKMPHVLIAGTTGSGKSVAINALIVSLVYKAEPNAVRLILVDPKMLELSVYDGIPHLLSPVVTDMKQASHALNWCVGEMERRYRLMSALGVRHITGANQKIEEARKGGTPLTHPFSLTPDNPEPLETFPYIVVVIDELADLMMVVGKKVEELIARLAQKARASGIHLVLATQRPSVDVITGLIKANIPTRVAFQVSAKVDSRTILDQMGAEALLGQGDMLYLPPGSGFPQRVHGAFVADHEVHKVVEYLKTLAEPNYIESILAPAEGELSADGEDRGADMESDPLYDEAVGIVLKSRRASISLVQRQLRIGYNRAARLIEQMERSGLVSAMQSNGNREILVPPSD